MAAIPLPDTSIYPQTIINAESLGIEMNADKTKATITYNGQRLRFRLPRVFVVSGEETPTSSFHEMTVVFDKDVSEQRECLDKYNQVLKLLSSKLSTSLRLSKFEFVNQNLILAKLNLSQFPPQVTCFKIDNALTSIFSLVDLNTRFFGVDITLEMPEINIVKQHVQEEEVSEITIRETFEMIPQVDIVGGSFHTTLQKATVESPDSMLIGETISHMTRKRRCDTILLPVFLLLVVSQIVFSIIGNKIF